MIFLIVALLLDVSQSTSIKGEKLLRINEWHNLNIERSDELESLRTTASTTVMTSSSSSTTKNKSDEALIDLHLFATCEKFSILFMTEANEFTRFRFHFDDLVIRKIDVDSVNSEPISQAPKVIGSCRETARKFVRINLKLFNSSITFRIADQLIRRPIDEVVVKNSTFSQLKVRIPQNASCCLIRALYLSRSDRQQFGDGNIDEHQSTKTLLTRTEPKMTAPILHKVFDADEEEEEDTDTKQESVMNDETTTMQDRKLPHSNLATTNWKILSIDDEKEKIKNLKINLMTSEEENRWSMYTIGENPTVTSTQKPRIVGSWTHAVNKEWSLTFVLCSMLVCAIMLFLVIFGTFMVFYLMTKPKGGKSPYAVDA